MPIEIRVGPPVVIINQGQTFVVMDQQGEIHEESELGAFSDDTRFISVFRIRINQRPWQVLSYSQLTHFCARWIYANPEVRVADGDIAPNQIGLTLERAIGGGLHDDLDIVNYSQRPCSFYLELDVRSDFADIFDVKNHQLRERGEKVTEWHGPRQELVTSYENQDFHRAFRVHIQKTRSRARYANGKLSFHVELPPGGAWHTCLLAAFEGTAADNPVRECYSGRDEKVTEHGRAHQDWHTAASGFASSSRLVERVYLQSVEDMGALRIFSRDIPKGTWIPAAGIPWFVTLFGRDSLIVSLQNLALHPLFARAALAELGRLQGDRIDDYRDEQPGKILHELRHGELAALRLIPHTPYYGTADATPLYLVVLSEAYRWTGDLEMVRQYRPAAERCLEWVDRYGDLDGDGFQEYAPRMPSGYHNQGWKDASDAVVYPDGTQVPAPIGTCELQGNVYDAKIRMAELFDVLGDPQRAGQLRDQAATLRRRFNEAFWMADERFIAFGLDPQKHQIKSLASNAGQCLLSGIVDDDRAEAVVQRLLEPDLWSGWGIRTLSARNPAYNPFSYQLGSVWPHDNAWIAAGFRRYGFHREASQVAKAIFDAASFFVSDRLPELFAGLTREADSFPVQYLGASTPQAWAAGSVFMFLNSMLGLSADAPRHRLYVDPWLPDWLPDLTLTNIWLGEDRLDLQVRGRASDCEVVLRPVRGEPQLARGRPPG